jgi:hypothetical protein
MTSCHFSLVLSHVLFILLAYTLLQAHLFLRHREEVNQRTRRRTLQLLGPTLEVIAAYYQQRFCLLTLPEFADILLSLEEPARTKLRKRISVIKRDLYRQLANARPP